MDSYSYIESRKLSGCRATCWLGLPRLGMTAVFALATGVWVVLSMTAWLLRKSRIFRNMRGSRTPLHAFRNF